MKSTYYLFNETTSEFVCGEDNEKLTFTTREQADEFRHDIFRIENFPYPPTQNIEIFEYINQQP